MISNLVFSFWFFFLYKHINKKQQHLHEKKRIKKVISKTTKNFHRKFTSMKQSQRQNLDLSKIKTIYQNNVYNKEIQ